MAFSPDGRRHVLAGMKALDLYFGNRTLDVLDRDSAAGEILIEG